MTPSLPGSAAERRYALLSAATTRETFPLHWTQQTPKTWAELVQWLDLDHPADVKRCGAYVLGTFRKTTQTHGSTECFGLHRNAAAVVTRSVVAIDADRPDDGFLDRAEALGVLGVWHTTNSHTAEQPHYRLLLPLDRDVTPDEYTRIATALAAALGNCDPGSTEPERCMFRPSADPPHRDDYRHGALTGEPVDADTWLARAPSEKHGDGPERPERGSVVASSPEPDYEALSADEQRRSDTYLDRAVSRELARLDACDALGWDGEHWDNTTFEVACNLIEFANSPWAFYGLDDAEADLLTRAPTDEHFGPKQHREKWSSALKKVGGKGRPLPDGVRDSTVTVDFAGLQADSPGVPLTVREKHLRLVPGGSFVLDIPEQVPAVWGGGTEVVWAQGEALTIAGPAGVGKTTLAGQLVRGRLVGGDVLGMPVAPTRSRVLYLAMDRPQQIARALRRTLGRLDRDLLDERLVVWPGPPLRDIAKHPETLLELAVEAGADTVVVDSLKDAAIGLSEDEVGAGYNRARQACLAAGVEVLELHHMVKKGENGGQPTTLAHLYGSVWIGAGAGSVVLLWGQPGDPVVAWRHLKQPAEEVGPFEVLHDHRAGTSSVSRDVDLLAVAQASGSRGLTAREAARLLYSATTPTSAEIAKARRKLEGLTRDGLLDERAGDAATRTATVWVASTEGDMR